MNESEILNFQANVLSAAERDSFRSMLSEDVFRRFKQACRRDAEAWAAVQTVSDWESFRDERIAALRASLGEFPPAPKQLRVETTGELPGEGFRIRKLVYESRPGQPVPAHLYLPDPLREGLPGILICHSHHRPKEQAELQDMGASWARSGAAVLVPDQPGHGERRDQPFGGRQDYYGRYWSGMQLHLAGQSLIGWMVRDLMRGVDLLLARPEVNREKIILVGAVAGGGDPVAAATALDGRVASAVPFNFGKAVAWSPRMKAPADAGLNWADNGSWEGTRNLRFSARDGFLRWVIVAACAPRPLVYAHEFVWKPETDPVWKRLKKIYALYGAEDNLATARGRGSVTGPGGPENTHCTNVGPIHRAQLYPAWKKWFGLEVEEFQQRREPEDLVCMTDAARENFKPRRIHELAAGVGAKLASAARRELEALPNSERKAWLRGKWTEVLGDVEPRGPVKAEVRDKEPTGEGRCERLLLETEPGIVVPALLLLPAGTGPFPAVVCVAQEGKDAFLKRRAAEIAELLAGGVAVCLPEVRGTGETRPDDERWREAEANTVSSEELMLGSTLLGARLRDLRATLRWLGSRAEIDAERLALWGSSFAPVNPPDFTPTPLKGDGIDERSKRDWLKGHPPAHLAEPMGALLAVFGALFEDGVEAALAEGGLVSFAAMIESYSTCVPHDCHLPGALAAGDLPLLLETLDGPVRLDAQVDGLNRPAGGDQGGAAAWLTEALKG